MSLGAVVLTVQTSKAIVASGGSVHNGILASGFKSPQQKKKVKFG